MVVLLVDDDLTVLESWLVEFESYPEYRVFHASSLVDAQRHVDEHAPDLAIVDLGLPKDTSSANPLDRDADPENGIDLLRDLDNRGIPAFALSGEIDPDVAARVGTLIIKKPVEDFESEVVERIKYASEAIASDLRQSDP